MIFIKKFIYASVCAGLLIASIRVEPARAASFTAGTAAELITAINTANTNGADDVITLTANITLTAIDNSDNGLPVILADGGNSLTIEGGGFTLSRSSAGGTSDFRFFEVNSGADLTLNNITLSNGYTDDYGAIWNSGTLTITNSTLSGNQAVSVDISSARGGAIGNVGDLTIDNSTFTGNSAASTIAGSGAIGGAIDNSGGTLTVSNSTFNNNFVDDGGGNNGYGGAIHTSGTAQISTSTFSGNSASSSGGGIMSGGNTTITNSTFSNNTAGVNGGGMYSSFSSPSLTNVTFSGNSASNHGGGMFNFASNPTLTNVTFSGNSASFYGGGMYNFDSNPDLTNVTFSGNSASIRGGGMFNNASNPTLMNVTFSSNSASLNGGGMYNFDSILNLNQSIIANSTGGDCVNSGSSSVTANFTLIEDSGANACGLVDGVNGNIIGSDPNLGALANNGGFTQTHALLAGSPAIDVVNPDSFGCVATDQRGVIRPQNSLCDLGAYEYGPVIPLVSATNPGADAVLASLSVITVVFNQDMLDDASADGAENVNNYLLVEHGPNASFDTQSCAAGAASDDVQHAIASASYNSAGFITTLTLSTPLTNGTYRLFVCGTTSIWSAAGLELNNGASDHVLNFTIGSGTGGTTPIVRTTAGALPATGFAPHKVTTLPSQPAELAYTALGDIWLEIPSQNIQSNIVGIPQSEDKTWDVTWLGSNTGWLNGTAFPSWSGNSVLTAHVTDSNGLPGPFANLKTLQYGDQIIVHLFGQQYIYEVQNSRMVRPFTTNFAFESMPEHSYLTLITCQGYVPFSDTYLFRRVVRAVLVDVK